VKVILKSYPDCLNPKSFWVAIDTLVSMSGYGLEGGGGTMGVIVTFSCML
jgi:hypothetical protein